MTGQPPRTAPSPFSLRRFAGAASCLLLGLPGAAALAQPVAAPALTPGGFVSIVPWVTTGVSEPIGVTNAGDGSNRLFVTERRGRIRIVKGTQALATPFLDISAKVGPCGSDCGERGLLGLAFHPDYETNGFFYVYYTRVSDGDIVIARYQVSSNADVALDGSELILLTIEHSSQANHNGGQLAFGPDGFLYAGIGDGGGGGDFLESGQSTSTLLGKILRLDVDGDDFTADTSRNYAIPAGNPFAGATPGADEIWAFGLRNPWRFSFDRQTGDLYIADVGQNMWEEIDFQAAGSAGGQNYGWDCREGAHPYTDPNGDMNANCPASISGFVEPILEYSHGSGDCSVTGGFVYRGQPASFLTGNYLFGDLCTGRIWRGSQGGGGPWSQQLLTDTAFNITSFGQDEKGGIYFTDLPLGGTRSASVQRLAAHTFSDVPPSLSTWPFVEGLVAAGITGGCSDTTFCPDNLVTRAQMAVFLLTAEHGAGFVPPPATGTVFNDVPAGSFAAAWIEQLAAEGISSGCGGGNYCPGDSITREQMAVFLLLAREGSSFTPPACTSAVFSDAPCSNPFAPWVNELARRGVTAGCGGGRYCGSDPITRSQMAVFLSANFGLSTP
jgi:glucose/arabinose dehydrogenase